MKNKSPSSSTQFYFPLYGWLLIMGLIIFGLYLLYDFGFLKMLIEQDVTYLSLIILVLFSLVSGYLGLASWRLSRQIQYTHCYNGHDDFDKSWVAEHLKLLHWQRKNASNESESLLAKLIEKVHRGHSTGWFMSDILIRLGLIGTVIGFVLMLGSIYQLKNSDVEVLKELLSTMGSGMQVALYTTLTGLGTGMLVGVQCQWLDRCADGLVSDLIEVGMKDDTVIN